MQYVSQDPEVPVEQVRQMARQVWDAGFPVIDDAVAAVYDWKKFEEKKANVIKALRNMKPGITEFIIHCTRPSEVFQYISDSGETRLSDLQLVTDPEVKKLLEDQHIILTTWRELKQRRDQAGAAAASPQP